MHFVSPTKVSISIIFNFSGDDFKSQDKLKAMLMQIFFLGGGDKVHYGQFENNK